MQHVCNKVLTLKNADRNLWGRGYGVINPYGIFCAKNLTKGYETLRNCNYTFHWPHAIIASEKMIRISQEVFQ